VRSSEIDSIPSSFVFMPNNHVWRHSIYMSCNDICWDKYRKL
jgi:hypothetical protein